jgi:cytochrome c-type biogenesis protein
MIDGPFALALTAGMVATVNPCGFAMLPAYLSFFLGIEGQQHGDAVGSGARLRRALVVSLAVSLGFLVVFALLGAVINAGTQWVLDAAKYATIVIGIAMVVLGIAMLAGYRLPLTTPKLEAGGKDRTLRSMFLFGVSYAVASLGCTIPTFLAVVIGTFTRESFLSGMLTVVAYGLGMALVLTTLTVTLALAEGGFLRVLRTGMRYVDRFAGAFLVLAGAYLVYYWTFNLSTNNGLDSTTGGGLAATMERWSGRLQTFLSDLGWERLLVICLAVVGVGVVAVWAGRSRGRGAPTELPPSADAADADDADAPGTNAPLEPR